MLTSLQGSFNNQATNELLPQATSVQPSCLLVTVCTTRPFAAPVSPQPVTHVLTRNLSGRSTCGIGTILTVSSTMLWKTAGIACTACTNVAGSALDVSV